MGVGDTNRYPGRGRPAVFDAIKAPGLPTQVPGGADGVAALPSRISTHLPAGGRRGGFVAGGIKGARRLFKPSIDKSVPYYVGSLQGNAPEMRQGIKWLRGRYDNTGALLAFVPLRDAKPDWTSNMAPGRGRPVNPLADIPHSAKPFNFGGLRKTFGTTRQLFDLLPTFYIQRPAQVKRTIANPQISKPYQPKLTRFVPAAAYGQTTKTLMPKAIADALEKAQGQFAGNSSSQDSTYGQY